MTAPTVASQLSLLLLVAAEVGINSALIRFPSDWVIHRSLTMRSIERSHLVGVIFREP